jgi:hypothetical protein
MSWGGFGGNKQQPAAFALSTPAANTGSCLVSLLWFLFVTFARGYLACARARARIFRVQSNGSSSIFFVLCSDLFIHPVPQFASWLILSLQNCSHLCVTFSLSVCARISFSGAFSFGAGAFGGGGAAPATNSFSLGGQTGGVTASQPFGASAFGSQPAAGVGGALVIPTSSHQFFTRPILAHLF